MTSSFLGSVVALLLVAGGPTASGAGAADETARHESSWLRWGTTVVGIALLTTLDQETRDWAHSTRSGSLDSLADGIRALGEPVVYIPVGTGLLGLGLATRHRPRIEAGARVAGTVLMAGVMVRGFKYAVGRSRPSYGEGNLSFDPLSNRTSFPSGHATMATAMAAAFAHEVKRPAFTWVVSGVVLAVAWSRVYDDVHWISDVAAGIAVGAGSAQVVQRIPSWWRPIHPVPVPGGVAIAWNWAF